MRTPCEKRKSMMITTLICPLIYAARADSHTSSVVRVRSRLASMGTHALVPETFYYCGVEAQSPPQDKRGVPRFTFTSTEGDGAPPPPPPPSPWWWSPSPCVPRSTLVMGYPPLPLQVYTVALVLTLGSIPRSLSNPVDANLKKAFAFGECTEKMSHACSTRTRYGSRSLT